MSGSGVDFVKLQRRYNRVLYRNSKMHTKIERLIKEKRVLAAMYAGHQKLFNQQIASALAEMAIEKLDQLDEEEDEEEGETPI